MYGKRKYRQVSKPVEATPKIDSSNIPTFVCRCKQVKKITESYVILNCTEYPSNKTSGFYRLCICCFGLFKTWVKG